MAIAMIGLDTAKDLFQVHGLEEGGGAVLRRELHRSELVGFFEQQPRCTVFLEACGAGHYWGRLLSGFGHEVKLIAPEAVRPFVKKGRKNDAADAAALCVAGTRPETRFVPIKSVEQQAVLALHAARSLLVKQQTMLANALRGLAGEFGVTVPRGLHKLEELAALASAEEGIPVAGRQAMAELHAHGRARGDARGADRAPRAPGRARTAPGHDPRRRADHGFPDRRHGGRPRRRLPKRPALRRLAGPRATAALHRRQDALGRDHQGRQRRDPQAAGAGGHLHGLARHVLGQQGRPVGARCAGAAAGAAGHGGAGEQAGAHRLGADDARRGLPGAGACPGRGGDRGLTLPRPGIGGGREPG